MKKTKWDLTHEGNILEQQKRNWLWRLFHRYEYPWKTVGEYALRKEYSSAEKNKLCKFLYFNRNLDGKDIIVLVNAIRPNTFKESIEEIKTSKYYFNATAKEDINLLRTSK